MPGRNVRFFSDPSVVSFRQWISTSCQDRIPAGFVKRLNIYLKWTRRFVWGESLLPRRLHLPNWLVSAFHIDRSWIVWKSWRQIFFFLRYDNTYKYTRTHIFIYDTIHCSIVVKADNVLSLLICWCRIILFCDWTVALSDIADWVKLWSCSAADQGLFLFRFFHFTVSSESSLNSLKESCCCCCGLFQGFRLFILLHSGPIMKSD